MHIKALTAAYAMGEIGRSAAIRGEPGGPAAFFPGKDSVSLGGKRVGAGLYSAAPLFKMMGAVELMSEECDAREQPVFGDSPTLL